MRALILFAMIVAGASSQTPTPAPAPQPNIAAAKEQKATADNRGTKAFPLVVNTYSQKSQWDAEQERKAEQERSQAHAWEIGFELATIGLGLLTAGILIVQARIFGRQARIFLIQSKSLNRQAMRLKQSVDEMKSSTDSIKTVATTLVANAQTQQRAYVHIVKPGITRLNGTPIDIEATKSHLAAQGVAIENYQFPSQVDMVKVAGDDVVFNVGFKNTGSTPTRFLVARIAIEAFGRDVQKGCDFADKGAKLRALIGPNDTAYLLVKFPVRRMEFTFSHNSQLFIWGWIDYDDVFKGTPRHRTEFCLEVIQHTLPNGDRDVGFQMYEDRNRADDDCQRDPEPYENPPD